MSKVLAQIVNVPFMLTTGIVGAAVSTLSEDSAKKGFMYGIMVPTIMVTSPIMLAVELGLLALTAPIDLMTQRDKGSSTLNALKDILRCTSAIPQLLNEQIDATDLGIDA